MGTLFQKVQKGLVLSMAVWASACSDVSFNPTDPNAAFTVPDGSQKETFSFDDDGSGAKVDVLFIVDNSHSMADEQGRLGSSLASFINSIGQVNWQIGITTTDVSNGPYGLKGSLLPFTGTSSYILTKNTPDYANVFGNTVVRQELLTCDNATKPCPSSDERPLQAAVMAMNKAHTENAGFFRNGADLAIVILSDEDEGSNGTGAIEAQAVVSAFATVFGGAKTLSTYGIVIQPGDVACFNQNQVSGGSYAYHAAEVIALTGGVTGSICDLDFGHTLNSIGNRVRDMVRSVTLKYTPDPDTVQIVIRPFDSSLTWEIIGNTIMFSKAPKKGTKIDVVYLPKP